MVVKGVELLMSRRQIAAMIECDSFEVVLRRKPKVATSSGGWVWGTEVTLDSQTARLIPFKRRMTEFLKNTELGNLPDLPYILLGYWDMDVERYDLFTMNGQEFRVETEDIGEPEVKTAVLVDYYGGEEVNG